MNMNKGVRSIMNNNEHLPVYGPGPVIGGVMVIITIAACFMRNLPGLETGRLEGSIGVLFITAGIFLIAAGITLWIYAVLVSKIDDGILNNHLVTNGAYAIVRNPIYSAIMIACTGVLLIARNLWFLIIPLFFWAFMTVVLKNTEEKWLKDLYGNEYTDYCRMVNRCWPWIPKK